MFVYALHTLNNTRYIINFPTKRHWRDASLIEDIQAGMRDLAEVIRNHNIMSVALPPLGCGLGGLEWSVVRPCIESELSKLGDVRIDVYEPRTPR
ncbi:hypothetical protein AGMMS49975_29500 [Clostridia bacterium]|nr:hypothetical protein AGMMS49975_29500 [Clostridia bacterium]